MATISEALPDPVEVAKAADVPPGVVFVAVAGEVEVVVVNTGDEFCAVQSTCTHAGGPLAAGRVVDGYALECPLHGARFDVRTGEVLKGPARAALRTYWTSAENGVVKVRLSEQTDGRRAGAAAPRTPTE